jgi:hypothetical protein
MDMWKGEKLRGADRQLTRAQLEAVDCVVRAVLTAHTATGGRGPGWAKVVEAVERAAA